MRKGAAREQQRSDESVRLGVDRLIYFSDAVVAIAITLLALDLPVPPGTSNADFLTSVNEHIDEYLAFLISFAVIAVNWFGHHRVFRFVRSSDGLLRWNMLWLLAIVLTPFAARVITEDGAFQARFIFYAAVQVTAGLAFIMMLRTIDRTGLLREDTPPTLISTSYGRLFAVAGMFLLSIPIALFTTWAFLCWVAIPIVGRISVPLVRRYRAGRGRAGGGRSGL